MDDEVTVIVFTLPLFYVSLKEIGVVGSDTYTWGIKDFHKCWLGSLAKRRPCLGPVRGSTLIETAHPGQVP